MTDDKDESPVQEIARKIMAQFVLFEVASVELARVQREIVVADFANQALSERRIAATAKQEAARNEVQRLLTDLGEPDP